MTWFGVGTYGISALVYVAITAILLVNHPRGGRAVWVVSAAGVSAVWAGAMAWLIARGPPPLAAIIGLDAARTLAWTICVLSFVASPARPRKATAKVLMIAASALCGTVAVLCAVVPIGAFSRFAYPAMLVMSLLGLLAVEQLFRNARDNQRRRLRLLSLGLGSIFIMDLFVYSQATLLGAVATLFWLGRGAVSVALGPMIVLAIKRQPEWERELFVSRQVAFYATSLFGVGAYLIAMSAVAYVIRATGSDWGLLLETTFLFGALGILLFVLFSTKIRARLKVLLVKHFYRHKYDHRHEWLRLTETLGRTTDRRLLAASALRGMAGIIGSQNGTLWLAEEGSSYVWTESLGSDPQAPYNKDHPIPQFLNSRHWVIDTQEYAREPDRYDTAFGDPADGVLPKNSIIAPLECQGQLHGFVILSKPPQIDALNFEDHDILRTAGRQVAVVLAQALALEQLTATRQFEAMNKLATFLMHDLKNLIAQQELVVANAQRFRHRPEFIDDAMITVKSSVERMKKVLEQLRSAAHTPTARSRIDVSKILMEVRSHCADRMPVPQMDLTQNVVVWLDIDRDRFASVLTHLIRNAQDATPPDGTIAIEVQFTAHDLQITVADSGKGMDQGFIRDRLFRPFDTTKGAKGMGIGAFQVRELVRAAGGDVQVESRPGKGTKFHVRLPTSGSDSHAAQGPGRAVEGAAHAAHEL